MTDRAAPDALTQLARASARMRPVTRNTVTPAYGNPLPPPKRLRVAGASASPSSGMPPTQPSNCLSPGRRSAIPFNVPNAVTGQSDADDSNVESGADDDTGELPPTPWQFERWHPDRDDINISLGQGHGECVALDSDAGSEDDEYEPEDDLCIRRFDRFAVTAADWEGRYEEAGMDLNGDDALLRSPANRAAFKDWERNGWDPVAPTRGDEYPGLSQATGGPARGVAEMGDNPLALFFNFFPKRLFHLMAAESNRYAVNNVAARAKRLYAKQQKIAACDKRSRPLVETLAQIHARLESDFEPFTPIEYVKLFALFIARAVCPDERGLEHHWDLVGEGVIPAGTFHKVMSKMRFHELVENMHLTDNDDPRASTDRLWKVRPLVDALQDSFQQGYRAGPFLSFGEGKVEPPARWQEPGDGSTKLFLTCCAETSYCLRLELYCGKPAFADDEDPTIDDRAGPCAVVRNLAQVLPSPQTQRHVVVLDAAFTSVPLFLELLERGIYAIGPVSTRRLGYPNTLKSMQRTRPKDVPQGTYSAVRSRAVPSLVACCWWDSRSMHFLGTGASLEETVEVRESRYDAEQVVPCPKLVLDYRKHKRGVEVFDRMRLGSLSLQRRFRFKKTYKSLVMGLLDCVLVNAYIVHKQTYMRRHMRLLSRAEFMETLQAQLLDVRMIDLDDWTEARPTLSRVVHPVQAEPQEECVGPAVAVSPTKTAVVEHVPIETDDFLEQMNGQGRKRMARACKVCSYMAPKGTRGKNTKFLCRGCAPTNAGDVYLCMLVRHRQTLGTSKTCFQIWHEEWLCGKRLPPGIEKQLHFRPPTGKRRARSSQDPGDYQDPTTESTLPSPSASG